jgi:hypothetical protein
MELPYGSPVPLVKNANAAGITAQISVKMRFTQASAAVALK